MLDPELGTPAGDFQQKTKDHSARKSKGDHKSLFYPDSEDKQPESWTSKQTNRRRSSEVSVPPITLEQDREEEEVEEKLPAGVEMDFD